MTTRKQDRFAGREVKVPINTRKTRAATPDLFSDPFGEQVAPLVRGPVQVLGARIQFESNSAELLSLVDSAYAAVPSHRLPGSVPQLRVRLIKTSGERAPRRSQPPPLATFSGAGFLGGATPLSDFVAVCPQDRAALVVVSPRMLRSAYHTRYELIEFAVYTLTARTQGLVSLHAACVGHAGRGVLLMGPSGSGKSTVALHCLLQGFDFLSEDSVLLERDALLATGIANFLHLRADSLRWFTRARDAAQVRRSPIIQRRSGVKKFEWDLRHNDYRMAQTPLKIAATLFLSAQRDGERPRLRALSKARLLAKLTDLQPYAANQPDWKKCRARLSSVQAFELGRGRHPLDTVEVLREILGSPQAHRPLK